MVAEVCRRPWFRAYLKLLAVVLAYGATVHVANMLGLSGTPRRETPLHYRAMDVILLAFDVVVAFGVWRAAPAAVAAFVGGILALQVVPCLVFTDAFAATPAERVVLYQLVGTELALIAGLAAVDWTKK